MAKILVIDGDKINALDETGFAEESKLQEYLEKYPSLIPLADVSDSASDLVCIGSEVTVPSGAIDLLFIDGNGLLTVVETKLAKNPEARRSVVGQVIEYASYVSQWTATDVLDRARSYLGSETDERLARLGIDASGDTLKDAIEDNLRKGKLRLIIAVDELIEPLRATVTFLNSFSTFDILLLQVSSFEESKSRKVLIPKLFGYTTRSGKSSLQRKQWDQETFLGDAEKRGSKERVDVLKELIAFAEDNSEGGVLWGTGATYGTFAFRKLANGVAVSVFLVYSDGTFFINFGSLKNKGVNSDTLESFRASLNEIPGVRIKESVVTESNKSGSIGLNALRNPENLELFKDAVLSLCRQLENDKL